MSYIYDNFEWPHCTSAGYQFPSPKTTSTTSTASTTSTTSTGSTVSVAPVKKTVTGAANGASWAGGASALVAEAPSMLTQPKSRASATVAEAPSMLIQPKSKASATVAEAPSMLTQPKSRASATVAEAPSMLTQPKSSSDAPIKMDIVSSAYPTEVVGEGYPHLTVGLIVEPYVPTTLEAEVNADSGEAVKTCEWKIMPRTGLDDSSVYAYQDTPTVLAGASVVHTFTAPATYHVSSTCTTSLGNVYTVDESVVCVYIRRELRDLTAEDVDSFLDSFKIMSLVSTKEGREIYGSGYHDLDHFVQMHLNAASLRSHDQIHDGMGVLTQHASITSKFELSLQAINPAVAVPYWDYTRDSATAIQFHKGDASSIFNSDWWITTFGDTSDLDHHISSGRFTKQRVGLANLTDSSDASSAYGFLRSPWNLNPSPYVTRYHKQCGADPAIKYTWPTCKTHWALTFKEKTWYDWVWKVSYSPHGAVHVWVGGVGGDCIDMDLSSFLKSGAMEKDEVIMVKNNMFIILKNMWRAYRIEMPTACAVDASAQCVIKCVSHQEDEDEFIRNFKYVGHHHPIPPIPSYPLPPSPSPPTTLHPLPSTLHPTNPIPTEQHPNTPLLPPPPPPSGISSRTSSASRSRPGATRPSWRWRTRYSAARRTGRATTWSPRAPSRPRSGPSTPRWTGSSSTR